MKKQPEPADVNKVMKRLGMLIFVVFLMLFVPLGVYVWHVDSRMLELKHSLRYNPPSDTDPAPPTVSVSGNYQITNPSHGQLVYVPAYSHVYHGSGEGHLLAVTLSVRNASIKHPITVKSVRYFDTSGKAIQSYLTKPISIAALGTKEFLVEREDASGGSGANFLVEWVSDQAVEQPVIECVMIDTDSRQGISFARVGTVIGELVPESAPATTDSTAK